MELMAVPVASVAHVKNRVHCMYVLTTLIILCLTVAPVIIVTMDGMVVSLKILFYYALIFKSFSVNEHTGEIFNIHFK